MENKAAVQDLVFDHKRGLSGEFSGIGSAEKNGSGLQAKKMLGSGMYGGKPRIRQMQNNRIDTSSICGDGRAGFNLKCLNESWDKFLNRFLCSRDPGPKEPPSSGLEARNIEAMRLFNPQSKKFTFKPSEKKLTSSEVISGQTQRKLVGSARKFTTSCNGDPNLINEEKPFLNSSQTGYGNFDGDGQPIELGRHSRHSSNPNELFLDENTRMNIMREKLGMVQSKFTVIFLYLTFLG